MSGSHSIPRSPLRDGTPVYVRSEHFAEECAGVITRAEYDDGWLYRIEVTRGDRLDPHRNEEDELWVWDFEVQPMGGGNGRVLPDNT